MNPGQEKFFNFILEKVEPAHHEEATQLLLENFSQQDNGTFTQESVTQFIPRMLELIKPDCMEEVKNILINYRV